jgi:hypothetical protein
MTATYPVVARKNLQLIVFSRVKEIHLGVV